MTVGDRINKIKYTLKHKKAFLKVEKELFGKNTLRGYLHDSEKIILYLILGVENTSKLHRKYSRHHANKAITEEDFNQMIVDWECARYTKPDKPLNAYETLYTFYPELENKVLPLLAKKGIAKSQ